MEEKKLMRRKNKALSENNYVNAAGIMMELGDLLISEERFDEAIVELSSAHEICVNHNMCMELALVNRGLGEAYIGLRDFNSAQKFQEHYLNLAREVESVLEEQRALANLGHTLLSKYLAGSSEDLEPLTLAKDYFDRSMAVCIKLKGHISKTELADMTARLNCNLGVVQECLGNYDDAYELISESISICKDHFLHEQLLRGYMALGSLCDKKSDYMEAIKQYNLVIAASRAPNAMPFKLTALSTKAEVLIKLGDFHGAKNALIRAYKIKKQRKDEREVIARNLKVVAVMASLQKRLLATNETDYEQLRTLYEKLGDGACELKILDRAIHFYEKMLEATESIPDVSAAQRATCYYSLAETYADDCQWQKAITFYEKELALTTELKDKLNTLSRLADVKECAKCSTTEVQSIYERAIALCRRFNETHEEGVMLKRFMAYLKRVGMEKQAIKLEQQLQLLNYVSSESDEEAEPNGQDNSLGDEINIEDISDASAASDEMENESSGVRRGRGKRRRKTGNPNRLGETPLQAACIDNNVTRLKDLLNYGHSVNVRDNCGWTPLHEACLYGYVDIVEILLNNGAAINDRGGTGCCGVTPLHDAATNGNLEVIDLMLKRGASPVALTDSGESVLDYLQEWYENDGFDMSSDDIKLYEQLVANLTKALERISTDKKIGRLQTNKIVEEISRPYVIPHGRNTRENFRRLSDVGSACNSPKTAPTETTKEYQSVMHNIRRNTTLSSGIKTHSSRKKRQLTPHVRSTEIVYEHDWLLDDMPQTNNKRQKRNFDQSQRTKHTPEKKTNVADHSCVDDVENISNYNNELNSDNITCDVEEISQVSAHENLSGSAINRRTFQLKLTNRRFGTEHKSPNSDACKPQVPSHTPPKPSLEISNPAVIDSTFKVDVSVDGILYCVPISHAEVNCKTIKWLAEKAAARYAKQHYVLPILQLEMSNGAQLADDDPLRVLFAMGTNWASDAIHSKIVRWETPAVVERYTDACSYFQVGIEEELVQRLECLSVALDASFLGIHRDHFNALFKALNRQYNLTVLDLSGNYLSDQSWLLLLESCNTFRDLEALKLSCMCLHDRHLHEMAHIFKSKKDDTTSYLQRLRCLDLSWNEFGNESVQDIATLTTCFELHTLNIAGNCITKISEIDVERKSWNCTQLEDLNLSDNELDNNSLSYMLSLVNPLNIKKIDISRTATFGEEQHPNISSILCQKLLQMTSMDKAQCALTELWASQCNLVDSHLFDLLLAELPNLRHLDISFCDKLTINSLKRLMRHRTLESFNSVGCPDILHSFDGALIGFAATSKLRKIIIGFRQDSYSQEFELFFGKIQHVFAAAKVHLKQKTPLYAIICITFQ